MLYICFHLFFFFKHKTAYEMRISDWSSDVCSSDLVGPKRLVSRFPRLFDRNDPRVPATSAGTTAEVLRRAFSPTMDPGSRSLRSLVRDDSLRGGYAVHFSCHQLNRHPRA